MKKVIAFITLFIGGVAAIYYNPTLLGLKSSANKDVMNTVVAVLPTIRDAKETVKGRGKIFSAKQMEVWLDDSATIEKIHVKQGDKVHRGQMLMTLRNPEIRKEINRVTIDVLTLEHELRELERGEDEQSISKGKRDLEVARMEYERRLKDRDVAAELFNAKAISSKQHEEAAVELRTVELRYNGEKQNLELLRDKQQLALKLGKLKYEKAKNVLSELSSKESGLIKRAPFDGIVTKLNPHMNNRSGDKEPNLVLADPDSVEVKLQIDTYDIARVRVGQPVDIYLEEYGQTLTGITKTIGMEVINKEAAFGREAPNIIEVVAEISGPRPESLKLGTQVEANIVVAKFTDKLMIPSQAILEENGKLFVYRDNNGLAERVFVKTGVNDSEYVEIKDGLKEDDRIITEGNIGMRENQKIVATLKTNAAESPDLAKTGVPIFQDKPNIVFQ